MTSKDWLLTDEEIKEATKAPMILSGHRRLIQDQIDKLRRLGWKDPEEWKRHLKASALACKDTVEKAVQQERERIFKEIEFISISETGHLPISYRKWQALKEGKK